MLGHHLRMATYSKREILPKVHIIDFLVLKTQKRIRSLPGRIVTKSKLALFVVSPYPYHLFLIDRRVSKFSDAAVDNSIRKGLDLCWDYQRFVFCNLAPNIHLSVCIEGYAPFIGLYLFYVL